MSSPQKIRALAERWSAARAAERANAQSYIIELCDALGVEPPRPAGTGYEFELPIKLTARDGNESNGFVDCYKQGHFVLEAKDYEEGRSNDVQLRRAYGQARTYAAHDPTGVAPPYLIVLDVGKTMLVWDRWTGTFGGYGAARRIELTKLADKPDDVALLVDIWTKPALRDPRVTSQAVTKEIAAHLAELASSLEGRGFAQERVARFLMRCVFTMFSEDVGLLPDEPFRRMLEEVSVPAPAEFPGAAEELWKAMDEGRRFGFRKLLRFNGHFFREAEALPLTREDLAVLLEAAKTDWSKVEPSIFGTLLTRALDPVERHRLGAEYTPPDFIERVVRPTVEEPIRERWTAVQAQVVQIMETLTLLSEHQRLAPKVREKIVKANDRVRGRAAHVLEEFHRWLRGLQVLDPACGSGNFLYVSMRAIKRIEMEVLHELATAKGGTQDLRMEEVDPSQFWGIEVKPWAREITELVLWIGFHQFWRQHHGNVQPSEPLLRDTGTLECRDAVLMWDDRRYDPTRDRPDPTPRLVSPVTGQLIPDPSARLRYEEYLGARPTPWPEADFIIGNPPYLGQARQREAFGDGYVDALRRAYGALPDTADLVMYWWHRAAAAVASGRTMRAGLITTNKITQTQNRSIVAAAAEQGAVVSWAIADHVWYDGEDGAEVRVAMTVVAKNPLHARLLTVEKTDKVMGEVLITGEVRVPRLNADLTAYADVPGAATVPLRANLGVASPGYKLHGTGFLMPAEDAERLLANNESLSKVLRPFRNGKDITARARGVYVVDFGLMSEDEARQFPVLFDWVRDRVKSEREANARATYSRLWWRFGEPRRELRNAMRGLERYIATPYVSKHRLFTFLDAKIAPEDGLRVLASDDAYHLGVLSSAIHVTWALAAGGRMGVRHTPRYNQSLCFDPFPFPDPPQLLRVEIGTLAERIEVHRAAALAAAPEVSLMKLYDVIEALRGARPLTEAQKRVHTAGACGVLRDLHDALDRSVAAAYGWSWPEPDALILERLVALHDERVLEEQAGRVRWLRPGYQATNFVGVGERGSLIELGLPGEDDEAQTSAATPAWPSDAVGQITALRLLANMKPMSTAEAVACFRGAPAGIVQRHLETLEILGELRMLEDGRFVPAMAVA